MDAIIEDAIAYIKEFFSHDYSGHDAAHSIRVYRTAMKIAAAEKANSDVAALAALLHDVDDWKLSPETAADKKHAAEFLKRHNVPEQTITAICKILEEVSFRGRDSVTPTTLEGKCVQDADRLDALGAIGIARTFAYGGSHNRAIYDPAEKPQLNMTEEEYKKRKSSSINHFYEKLLLLQHTMNTETARQIAARRTKFMEDFLNEFYAEWDGRQ